MRRFGAGDIVRVRAEDAAVRWRKPHLRTPGYLFGLVGIIERDCVVRHSYCVSSAVCIILIESLIFCSTCFV